MDIKVYPSKASGEVSAIGSKSDIHRLLILSALSDDVTIINGFSKCDDTLATIGCIKALGAECEIDGKRVKVTPIDETCNGAELDCCESGSTLRFMLPVAAAVADKASFKGSGRLPERPIGELLDAMESGGVKFSAPKLLFEISGRLRAGRYTLPGNISSQYISGLLMALSVTEGESEIALTSKLESASYVKMTLSTLRIFGVDVCETESGYKITGRKKLRSPKEITADGDWSNSAFFICLGALNGEVSVAGLNEDSVQGDKKVISILREMGAEVGFEGGVVTSQKSELKGARIDLTDTPDLLPILAVVASYASSKTEFYGAKRLKLKESDRLATVANMINNMGGKADITDDGIIVYPKALKGGVVDGCNDHRIVMSAAIAATVCEGEVTILGAQAVNKSYPEFFSDFAGLGGVAR